jgi:RNA recognition motif-containing protein
MKVMVLNIPRDFTEDELAKLFKTYGNIQGCTLVIDEKTGLSKGFGFVEMALEHEGELVIEELHGTMIGKNKIRVKQAQDK